MFESQQCTSTFSGKPFTLLAWTKRLHPQMERHLTSFPLEAQVGQRPRTRRSLIELHPRKHLLHFQLIPYRMKKVGNLYVELPNFLLLMLQPQRCKMCKDSW